MNGCFADGPLLFWRNACVGYSLQRRASAIVPFDVARRYLADAFNAWSSIRCANNQTTLGIRVVESAPVDCGEVRYNRDGPNQNVITFRDDGWPYHDAANTLGLTTLSYAVATGEIYDADMEINASGPKLATAEPIPRDAYDLARVVTHEAGHFLGLAHSTIPDATMFATYPPGERNRPLLAPDDVAGACTIYPSTTSRLVSAQPTGTCTWCPRPVAGATELLAAGPCDSTPVNGFTPACVGTSDDSGCSVSAARSSFVPGLDLLLAAALLFVRRARFSVGRIETTH